jgi:CRP/FNR family transcriptional regulator, cyclic AMP receptor protein
MVPSSLQMFASMTSVPAIVEILQSVPYLTDLRQAVIQTLAAVAIERAYAAGQIIFVEGEPVFGLFVIGEGTVKISRHSPQGREHILHLLHRGDTFNDVAALDGGPNPATAIAYTNAKVWAIPRAELKHIVDQHPELAWALIESMARRARYLVTMVEDLAMHSVKGRLVRLLLEQAKLNESEALPRVLTQEEMANRLGTVREMVGRALRSLAADGIIEFDRHRIVILDWERLAGEASQ